MRFAVIDCETTGFSPARGDRIVELAIVTVDRSGIIEDEFVSLVNPERDVGPTRVHGITASDVAQAPTFRDLAGDILQRLNPCTALAAHNAIFDARFLTHEFQRLSVDIPEVPTVCTMRLSGGGRLADCCDQYGIARPAEAHTALDDARATASLLSIFLGKGDWSHCSGRHHWPILPTMGRAPLCRHKVRERQHRNEYLSRLCHLVGGSLKCSRAPEAVAYLQMLESALEDRRLDECEGDMLLQTAVDWGLGHQDVLSIHDEFVRRLATAAWQSGGVISELERHDLQQVAKLLGYPDQTLAKILEETRTESVHVGPQESVPHESLIGKTVCFTGDLRATISGIQVSKSDAHEMASSRGMGVSNSVTKKVDILVVADPETQSTKAQKAKKYGIRILSEAVFWNLLGVHLEGAAMPAAIRFTCAHCNSTLEAPARRAGTSVACPKCKARIAVPLSNVSAERGPREETPPAPKKRSRKPRSLFTRLAYVKTDEHQQRLRKVDTSAAAILREPDNPVDPNACMVMVNGETVGYLPKKEAASVSRVMDKGEWTYAIPFLRTREFEGVIYADVAIEPHRLGPNVTGLEHLQKRDGHQGKVAEDSFPKEDRFPETVQFSCSHCRSRLKASANRIGTSLPCPKCKMAVTVPFPE